MRKTRTAVKQYDISIVKAMEFGFFEFIPSENINSDINEISKKNLLVECNCCGRIEFSHDEFSTCMKCTSDNADVMDSISEDFIPEPYWKGNKIPSSKLFDEDKADARENELEKDTSKYFQWQNLRERLSGNSKLLKWPSLHKIYALEKKYPNYYQVLDYIKELINVSAIKKDNGVRIDNILLVGSPSCGKTSFSENLSKILAGQHWARIELHQGATNFSITGLDYSYISSKSGKILQVVAGSGRHQPTSNPIVILDEIDKAQNNQHSNTQDSLLSLLEKNTARTFSDNFFGVPIDASRVNYIATANSLSDVPKWVKSRFTIYEIPDYSKLELIDIVIPNIYKQLINDEYQQDKLPTTLTSKTKYYIYNICKKSDPRLIRKEINRLISMSYSNKASSPYSIDLNINSNVAILNSIEIESVSNNESYYEWLKRYSVNLLIPKKNRLY